MATALTLPATDALANQQPQQQQQPASDKWRKKSLQADGASFCTPDNSPSQEKFYPSSPEPSPLLTQTIPTATTSASPVQLTIPTTNAIQETPQPATLEQILSRPPILSDASWTVEYHTHAFLLPSFTHFFFHPILF